MQQWHLDKSKENELTTLRFLASIFAKKVVLILIACVLGTILGGTAKLVIGNTYAAHALILPQLSNRERLPQGTSAGAEVEAGALVESQLQILQSYALAHNVVAGLGLNEDPKSWLKSFFSWLKKATEPYLKLAQNDITNASPAELATKRLLGNLKLSRQKASYVIQAEYVDRTPDAAASILNAVASEYVRINRRQKLVAELRNAQDRLIELAHKYGPQHPMIVATNREIDALTSNLSDVDASPGGVLDADELAASGLVIPALPEKIPQNGSLFAFTFAGLLAGLIASIMLILFLARNRLLNHFNGVN